MKLSDARAARPRVEPGAASSRGLLIGLVALAAAGGALWPHADATLADADLVRLLRAMAGLKAVIASGAVAAVLWRLGAAVTPARWGSYAAACGLMAAGPGLIWNMGHIAAGAVVLHAGLLATIVLLWRDPATADRLSRRAALRRA